MDDGNGTERIWRSFGEDGVRGVISRAQDDCGLYSGKWEERGV